MGTGHANEHNFLETTTDLEDEGRECPGEAGETRLSGLNFSDQTDDGSANEEDAEEAVGS